MLRLRAASKRYGESVALHPTDLEIAAGRTVALLGPSGCGKSTILRLITGLIEPSGGEVEFAGQPLGGAGLLGARRRMGYVIQDGGLFPHLTAAGNVRLLADHLGRPADESRARLEELCALTRFPPGALDRFPAELSGGQRQRVGLMRALMLRPEVLLLDEPLGALDPLVRAALQDDLREIFTRLKLTTVLVTHDLAEAAYLADEIVLLDAGRIVQRGTLADLRGRPAGEFVSRFLGAQRSLTLA